MEAESAAGLLEHELVNRHGDRVRLLNLGARIGSIALRLSGGTREVVLGYGALEEYLRDRYYMGCVVGRFCNRIRGARFALDGSVHRLSANAGAHHLHGGALGFDKRLWTVVRADERRVAYRLSSEDGDQGYPGRLDVEAEYGWGDDRKLTLTFAARTDRPTHVNLTSHAYFNLDGRDRDVLDHWIAIDADRIVAVDAALLPTGELAHVAGSALDLRHERTIGSLLESGDPAFGTAGGPDHNYVLRGAAPAAALVSSARDLKMSLETTYPGLQLYAGQHLRSTFRPFGGLCLEPQYFPDSPNHAEFPSTLLTSGRLYRETIRYRFEELREGGGS